MKLILFIICCILVFIFYEIKDHYYHTSSEKRAMPFPFFMPKKSETYYIFLESLLEKYLFCSFAKSILKDAEAELRNSFGLYKSNCTQTANWQYVKDLCECSEYEPYVFEAWAIIYVHAYLDEIVSNHQIKSVEEPVALKLKEYVDKKYSDIVNYSNCPKSFIDNF